jgi:lipopolysaccharide transport system ATP-binding protein
MIIRVEDLGKKYILGQQRQGYTTLRDSMTHRVKNTLRFLQHPTFKTQSPPKEFWALKDVSFEIQQGDRIGIIGRNGAGKSTLLKILSRITEPTVGSIRLRGRVASLLEVGTGFHPELTGRENIFLNGAILGMTKAEIQRKFDQIVAFAEVEPFLDTPVKRYSSGMYVRLAFAVAAHLEPEILIVDEVLAVGDVQFQQKCLGKMEEIGNQGRTVLFVSHIMPAVERLCQSAILLQNGQVSKIGTASEVVQSYLDQGNQTVLAWQRDTISESRVYFQTVYLRDQTGDHLQYVTTRSALTIVIEYVVERHCHDLHLSLDLLDDRECVIFASNSKDVNLHPPETPGRYCLTVSLPPEILLANTYGIRVNLWSPTEGILDRLDQFRFTVAEVTSAANLNYQGKPGHLFIRCHWAMTEMSSP